MVERFAGIDRAAAERTGALAERLAFDLTEELGYRYPDFSDRSDPAICQLAVIATTRSASDTRCCKLLQAAARPTRRRAGAHRACSAWLGSSSSTTRCSSSRECALEVRGRDSPRMFLPPGRGRGSSVGSIVCYLTGLRTSTRSQATSRSDGS